jgi:transcription initiation factor TFIID subunit 6
MAEENPRRPEAEKVLSVLMGILGTMREGRMALANGHNGVVTEELRGRLDGKVGEFLAAKISEAGEVELAHAILES